MLEKIFIDTDLGGDCDDAGAIALANILQNEGTIEVVGITHTTSAKNGVACIDIINRFYGNDIPLGGNLEDGYCDVYSPFLDEMANKFHSKYENRNNVTDSVKFIRKTLDKQEDNSVTFVCIGQLNNVSKLVDSLPDEISSLTGLELIKKKIKKFVIMGGLFKKPSEEVFFCGHKYETEYNIVCDIKAAQNFISKVNVPVYFNDFKCGYLVYTLGNLLDENNLNNPVTFAYKLFSNKPRESWDPLTMYFASLGADDIFKISNEGKVSIDDKGTTTFDEEKKNKHYYLTLLKDSDYIANKINAIFERGKKYEKN